MGYQELIEKVQDYSGLPDEESKEVLDCTVESVAALLTEEEREDFASQLPTELQDIALDAELVEDKSQKDVLLQFEKKLDVDESKAKKLLVAAWEAIKDTVMPGEIENIRAQLPNASAALLS